jgi:hypothetical protein
MLRRAGLTLILLIACIVCLSLVVGATAVPYVPL